MSIDLTPFIAGAQELQQKTGIPASITLAQIVQESSGSYAGGLSGLAHDAHNLFGEKGQGDAGSVTMNTQEFLNGVWKTIPANFKKFTSFTSAIMEHGQFLSAPRYANQFKDAKTVNDYAQGLQDAGYATDPAYAKKLVQTINSMNLHQYDIGNIQFKPLAGSDPKQEAPLPVRQTPSCRH